MEPKDMESQQEPHPPTASVRERSSDEKNEGLAPHDHEYLTGFRLWSVMISTTIISFLMLLDSSIVSTVIPRLTDEFHSLLDVGWYGAAYQLANASFQPLAGTLYTHLSSKWTFITFVAVFELGSLISAVASSSVMLIIGRAIEGLGASGIQNGIFTIMVGCVPMKKRPALLGLGMGVSQVGMILGPVIGGAFTEYVTWRWCFYINLPVGAAAMLMLLSLHIPEQTVKKRGLEALTVLIQKLDILGFVFFAGSAIQLLLALQYGGNQYRWNSSVVVGLFCGAGVTVLVFAFLQHRKGQGAIIPLTLVRKTFVWCGCLVMLFSISTTFCASYYLPIYFQAIKGASPSMSGVYLLPTILSQVLFVVPSGAILGRTGYVVPFSFLGAALTAVGSGLISTYTPATATGQWIGYQIILGAGRGIAMQMPIICIQGLLPPSQVALGQSFIMLGHTFGGAISLSIAQTIFSNSLRADLLHYAPSVNADAVIAAGATTIRTVVPPNEIPSILQAYSLAVDRVFYFTVACAVCSLVFAWGFGWKDIRKKPEEK